MTGPAWAGVARGLCEIGSTMEQYFGKPISDDAIVQRADKARCYKNENPHTNPRQLLHRQR
jgi:hypothetical protein